MSNESKTSFTIKKENDKLTSFYKDIVEGRLEPSLDNQKKFMLQLLNTKITQLEPKTDRIRIIHYCLKITVMLLSGLSTVILGIKFSSANWLSENNSNIALIITAIVTFLSSLAVFWDTETYWKRNKIMLNKLKELRYEYVFFVEGQEDIKSNNLKEYLDKFIGTLGDEYWESFLKGMNKQNTDVK